MFARKYRHRTKFLADLVELPECLTNSIDWRFHACDLEEGSVETFFCELRLVVNSSTCKSRT